MLLSCWLALVAPLTAGATGQACHASTGAQRGALVELYTSEGCSSCPPADRYFAQVAKAADPSRLSLLAFHVDYWDSIGWPDRFEDHAFSVRQGQRVRAVTHGTTVYTPQVMVGNRVGVSWSSPGALATAIREAVAHPSPVSFDLAADRRGDGYDVALKIQPLGTAMLPAGSLFVALYENGLSTQVKAGENDGALLRHERVVRQLLGPFALDGAQWSRTLHLASPKGAAESALGLTAFVQDAQGDTLQALSLPLVSCAE